jgi:hypothetical protein
MVFLILLLTGVNMYEIPQAVKALQFNNTELKCIL